MPVCNLSNFKVEGGRSGVLGHPQTHSEFEGQPGLHGTQSQPVRHVMWLIQANKDRHEGSPKRLSLQAPTVTFPSSQLDNSSLKMPFPSSDHKLKTDMRKCAPPPNARETR